MDDFKNDDYLQITANFFGGDPGLLNSSLVDKIKEVARINDGRLRSTQVISLIIHLWQKDNPESFPYGEQ